MMRLVVVLVLALVGCALSIVSARYESRWAVIELDRARHAERELDVEWRRLQLELTDYAQHARIDAAARQALKMTLPGGESVMYVRPGGIVAAPVAGTGR